MAGAFLVFAGGIFLVVWAVHGDYEYDEDATCGEEGYNPQSGRNCSGEFALFLGLGLPCIVGGFIFCCVGDKIVECCGAKCKARNKAPGIPATSPHVSMTMMAPAVLALKTKPATGTKVAASATAAAAS